MTPFNPIAVNLIFWLFLYNFPAQNLFLHFYAALDR